MLPFRRVLATLFVAALLTAGCTADSAGSAAADSTALDSTAAPPSTAGDLPPSRAQDAAPAPDYEQALSDLLAKIVTADGHVRYDLLREQEIEPFRRVLKAVEDYDATALDSQAEKLAFWINAYNVQMLANVLES